MPNEIAARPDAGAIEQVLIGGDLSKLTPEQRLVYYKNVCESVGLNPLTKPFDYLTLNGKMVLYAKRDATDQLRKIHGVSLRITARENVEGVYVVTASATDKGGRVDESTGAVTVNGLKGDALANALMKAETKAKRRVTLSICGLGILDETEIETIPAAVREPVDVTPAAEPEKMRAKLAEAVKVPLPPIPDPLRIRATEIADAIKAAPTADKKRRIIELNREDVAALDQIDTRYGDRLRDLANINQKEAA